MDKLSKLLSFILLFFILSGCGSSVTKKDYKTKESDINLNRYSNVDSDNDYIPDNIEALIGSKINNSDQNHNGIVDGLESSGEMGDRYFAKEWYIKSTGQIVNRSNIPAIKGNDLGLLEVYHNYMGYNNGKPVGVQIVDFGVDINHEDLKDNISLKDSFNGGNIGDPSPLNTFRGQTHGTKIAGIVAARAFNGKGVRGVAPFAKIAGSNWLVNQNLDDLEQVWLGGDVVVSNNSWGTYYNSDTIYEKIMKKAQELREGKGRVFVFAAGNDRSYNGDANLQYIENNRFAIAVAALGIDDTYAPYSTPGANIFISAYGGSVSSYDGPTIVTTTVSGKAVDTYDNDSKKDYTYSMSGTSAAAPMVSGAIALINEACPDLTMRDVKYLIATNAKVVDSNSSSWIRNSAGVDFSTDYGFGKIDTKAVIDACRSGYEPLGEEVSTQLGIKYNELLDNRASVKKDIKIKDDIIIEHVELTIDINSTNASAYMIYLISPNGTKIKMLRGGSICGDSMFIPTCNWMNGGFRVTTGAFIDESSAGTWRVVIESIESNVKNSILKSLKLKIYGHRS